MKISTLVCVHSPNTAYDELLFRAVESLGNQSRLPDEIVFVLDECHSETAWALDQCLKYSGLCDISSIHERGKKEGLAAAKNFGIDKCTGDWITFLDADDQWMECKLEVQEEFIDLLVGCDVIATNAWDLGEDEIMRPNCFCVGEFNTDIKIKERLLHPVVPENVICHGSVAIKKSSFDKYGKYQDVRGAEDFDLWRRWATAGAKFFCIPERLYIWSHGTSVER